MSNSSIVRTSKFRPHPVKLTWAFLVAGCFLATATAATAPISLTLSSSSAVAGGTASLNLSLSSTTTPPAGLQWSFNYSPSDFTAIHVVAGSSSTNASKTLICNGVNGTYTCLLYGVNSSTMADGVIATAILTLSTSANLSRPVQISSAEGTSVVGDSITTSVIGGLVTVPASGPIGLSSLICTPSTVTGSGSATCAVTLNASAPVGGAVVTLTDNSAFVSTPVSVTVAAGATSASFAASVSTVTTDSTAALTASLNGSTTGATLNLVARIVPSALSCSPATVLSGATTICTITLNKVAPTGGQLVAVSDNSAALTVPASVTVSAGSTTATFTATAASVSTATPVTITTTANGVSTTASVSVTQVATYSISGNAGLAGVIMTLSGGQGATTTTNSSNSYAFTGLAANGHYTVTPTKTGYSFTPASAAVTNLTSNRIVNFTASQYPGTYSISGVVTANGAPVSGVTVALTGTQTGNTTTAADGTYSFSALPSGGYTLTPARNGFTFSPPTTTITLTGNQTVSFAASTAKGTLSSNRSVLRFGATPNGAAVTGEQEIIITASDNLPLGWTVVSDKPWLKTTPSSGVGTGRIAVWLASTGLPSAGTVTANLTVNSGSATNAPLTIQVVLAVSSAAGAPFGSFDTPVDGASGLGSGFAVTGWALDDLGVKKVQIWRDRVGVEPMSGNGLVFIGDAQFVPNARPDVEHLYPNHPANYRAGWGYMLLSNFLPNPSGPAGNGTYRLHAVAVDEEGHETDLGVKTITVDNAHWVKPFGAIDAPGPGATIGGSAYTNAGWALTPMPNKILNTGSSLIRVYVDGVFVGSPTYNEYRPDVASLFNTYANAAGAGGSYSMDTTKYANGLHTITWSVTDNGGRTDGIGSRFFSILNSGPIAASVSTDDQAETRAQLLQNVRQSARMLERPSAPTYRKGHSSDDPLSFIPSGGDGLLSPIELDELERVEIHLPAAPVGARWAGGVRVNGEMRPLPAGSTLDDEDGVFYWQLGPGFLGEYQLEFSCQSGLETAAGTVVPVRVKARESDRRQ